VILTEKSVANKRCNLSIDLKNGQQKAIGKLNGEGITGKGFGVEPMAVDTKM
jgi:hypothetical protein